MMLSSRLGCLNRQSYGQNVVIAFVHFIFIPGKDDTCHMWLIIAIIKTLGKFSQTQDIINIITLKFYEGFGFESVYKKGIGLKSALTNAGPAGLLVPALPLRF